MTDGPDGFERRKPDGLVGVTSLPVAQCDSPGWAYRSDLTRPLTGNYEGGDQLSGHPFPRVRAEPQAAGYGVAGVGRPSRRRGGAACG